MIGRGDSYNLWKDIDFVTQVMALLLRVDDMIVKADFIAMGGGGGSLETGIPGWSQRTTASWTESYLTGEKQKSE